MKCTIKKCINVGVVYYNRKIYCKKHLPKEKYESDRIKKMSNRTLLEKLKGGLKDGKANN
jgi:hypothetical protein